MPSSYRFCYHFWNWLSHPPRVWRRSSCSRRSWGARPGAFERARRLLQLFANFLSSKRKTQLESMLTRVQCIPELPKSAVRGRHVRCFESTWQFCLMSMNASCAPLFVLKFVCRTRFHELEVSLRKEDKEGRYFVSLKGPTRSTSTLPRQQHTGS